MNKSIYSLVLTDEVVAAIDRLAYETGTSRSNMINQVLAEYVSYTTPEKRMREIFEQVENMLTAENNFQVMLQPSDSMFSLRSALRYKYNPNVKYSVELNHGQEEDIGELRVSVRSQNSTLMLYMLQFFKLWMKIEDAYLNGVESMAADDRFVRKLRRTGNGSSDNETIGRGIADYIRLIDSSLKIFFNNLERPQAAAAVIEQNYRAYLSSGPNVL